MGPKEGCLPVGAFDGSKNLLTGVPSWCYQPKQSFRCVNEELTNDLNQSKWLRYGTNPDDFLYSGVLFWLKWWISRSVWVEFSDIEWNLRECKLVPWQFVQSKNAQLDRFPLTPNPCLFLGTNQCFCNRFFMGRRRNKISEYLLQHTHTQHIRTQVLDTMTYKKNKKGQNIEPNWRGKRSFWKNIFLLNHPKLQGKGGSHLIQQFQFGLFFLL